MKLVILFLAMVGIVSCNNNLDEPTEGTLQIVTHAGEANVPLVNGRLSQKGIAILT